MAEEMGTFLLRFLVRQPENAVPRNVDNLFYDQAPADGADLGEVVVAKGEVLEVG